MNPSRRFTLVALSLVLPALAAGCSRSANGKPGAEAGRPPVAVDTSKVAVAELTQAVDVVGSLEAKQDAEVKTEYSGIIAEVFVTQWVHVTKGTPLARLDTREAEAGKEAARAAMLQADVALARAARELERSVKLKQAGLATQQSLDDARTASEAARAQAAAAKAQLEMADTKLAKAVLRAPIDGVVAARSVNVGDYVENMGNPKPIFRIVDNRLLELTATVPSARLEQLRVGQPLTFESDAIPGKVFTGKVSFINPAADEASRTVRVKAEVPNEGGALKTGLFVKGRIVTGTRTGVLTVPRTALVSWDTASRQAAVFVVDAGAVKRATIETGAVSGDAVEVVKGLSSGSVVVTRGGFNLRDGDKVASATPAAAGV